MTSASFSNEGIERLTSSIPCEIVRYKGPLKENELIQLVEDVDAVIASHDQFTRRVIEKAGKLKVIGRHGIGYSEIDLQAATERGVFVTYTPVPEEFESVAEFTVGLILAVVRMIPSADRSMKEGKWERTRFIGNIIRGKTIGIIGLGNIGRRVAELLKGFEVNVIAYDPYVSGEIAAKYGVKLVDLHTLLRSSDIITIHAPLTEETRGMIGWREIELMKPGVYIINTARGKILLEDALYKAILEGKVAGAALDVFEEEPPDLNKPLYKMEKVIVTPHIAAYTREGLLAMDLAVADDVVTVLKGGIPRYLVNKEVLSR
ncbi:MAG: hydroxyacid dehydrogenase [Desulfurococcaceae archaeon]